MAKSLLPTHSSLERSDHIPSAHQRMFTTAPVMLCRDVFRTTFLFGWTCGARTCTRKDISIHTSWTTTTIGQQPRQRIPGIFRIFAQRRRAQIHEPLEARYSGQLTCEQ